MDAFAVKRIATQAFNDLRYCFLEVVASHLR